MNRFESREQQRARRAAQAAQAAEAQLQMVRDEYGRYCKSRFMTVEQALLDFEELIRHPKVQCVAFATISNARYFLIGTSHISIIYKGERYNIGEFIIMIHRPLQNTEKQAPVVMVENVTPSNAITGGVRGKRSRAVDGDRIETVRLLRYAHPHVFGNPGPFCMQTGKDELNNAITEGNLLEAFHYIISALQSAGPGMAYHEVTKWPRA